ncbi:MAG: hypothetical protein ACLPV4_04305 [Solirubrobacteraceae bacterium]
MSNARKHLIFVASVAIPALAVASLAAASLTLAMPSSTSFYLDSYNANNNSGGNSVSAPITFVDGHTYRITVSGTFSAWGAWPHRRCGKPEPSAVYLSPASDGQTVTAVGDDALFEFAHPLYKGRCTSGLPRYQGLFQINLGSGWHSFVPTGGIPSRPTRNDHVYKGTIIGTGTVPRFRIVDWHPSDNNGQLRITIS